MPDSHSPHPVHHPAAPRIVSRLGWSLVIVWTLVLLTLTVLRPRPFAGMWLVALQQLLGGRALGIATGISLDIPKPFLIAHCTLMDMMLIMVLYPLLVLGVRKAGGFRLLRSMVESARSQARRHKKRLQNLGPVGLSLFVLFPLWGTGPMSGTVVGHLIGMHPAVALAAVAVGNLGAVTGWTLFFNYVQGFSETYGKWLPVALLVAFLGFFAVTQVVKRVRHRRRPRTEPPEPESVHP